MKGILVKRVKQGESVPLFYAPFEIDVSRNYEAKCSFIGLNILLYFMVELYYSVLKMVSTTGLHRDRKKL